MSDYTEIVEAESSAEKTPDIEAFDLVKSYRGRTVVNGVSLKARCGEVVGLLGPNGAGKTTTFYMVVGLVRPESGRILLRGKNVTRLPVYKRAREGLGYLAQEPSVFRKLTVSDNLMAILESLPLTRPERRDRCEELLESLKLTKVARQRAYTLSGGERRKLEIARALVRQPAILMLDEPFSGVDPLAVNDIQQIVLGLREQGLGIIITDHNVRETLSIVDRAYLVFDGQVLREGSSDFLINDEVARELYLGRGFKM
ncbi:MAG: LPS export ABC transporter ATP-binding protein [Lentisphaerae bacterium]|nr:LPS export ABC transporter ATP-binding protein [Lentisphaerota bacterium]